MGCSSLLKLPWWDAYRHNYVFIPFLCNETLSFTGTFRTLQTWSNRTWLTFYNLYFRMEDSEFYRQRDFFFFFPACSIVQTCIQTQGNWFSEWSFIPSEGQLSSARSNMLLSSSVKCLQQRSFSSFKVGKVQHVHGDGCRHELTTETHSVSAEFILFFSEKWIAGIIASCSQWLPVDLDPSGTSLPPLPQPFSVWLSATLAVPSWSYF